MRLPETTMVQMALLSDVCFRSYVAQGLPRWIQPSMDTNEPPCDKTNKMTAPNEYPDQSGHPPSLIKAFAVRSLGS